MIYRPPFESRSLLLEVTKGCSHNGCTFCTMYRGEPFRVMPMSEIEDALKEAQLYRPGTRRVFLENGDPFCLDTGKLIDIAQLIRRYLPETDTITMYASILNIQGKSNEELRALRAQGINELNIGVESGLDEALDHLGKGYTAQEAAEELGRLEAAGIDYSANVILGAGGREKRRENARTTADLMNRTSPYLIFIGTLHPGPGCQLFDEIRSGAFHENTIGEYIEEEELFLSELTVYGSYIFGWHPSNIVPMSGLLGRDRPRMLSEIQKKWKELEQYLHKVPERGIEGAVRL